MNERISGLSKRASPLSSLLAKLWIDVCVTLALLGLSFPILEMDHLMEPPQCLLQHTGLAVDLLIYRPPPTPPHAHQDFDEPQQLSGKQNPKRICNCHNY